MTQPTETEAGRRIWASVKYTINLGNYQSANYDMGISIDPALPIQPQLDQAREPLKATADFIEDMLLAQMQHNHILTAIRQRQPGPTG